VSCAGCTVATPREARSRLFDRLRLPGLAAAGRRTLVAPAVVAALVAVVKAVEQESDVERPAAAPGKKVVATDVERGVRFSLDGRVLTVQLLPPVRNQTFETVSGARISATCGANVAAPPGDPRSETTLTRLWPAGQTSLSYRFPRDVSSWCRLDDQSGSVAFVGFPARRRGRGADRRDRHQVGAADRRQPSDLQRLHGPDRLRADHVPTGRGDADPELQADHAGVGSDVPHRDGPGNRH
jgi:hypothetical protein